MKAEKPDDMVYRSTPGTREDSRVKQQLDAANAPAAYLVPLFQTVDAIGKTIFEWPDTEE